MKDFLKEKLFGEIIKFIFLELINKNFCQEKRYGSESLKTSKE